MRTLHYFPSIALLVAGMLATPLAAAASPEDINEVNRLHQSGDSAQALLLAEKALAARPKDAQLRFLKGVVLAETSRSLEAIEVFQKLTEDFPELAEPYNNLAALHAARGDYDKARVALEQALRSNPGYATALENLGDVHAMLASQAYARAIALDPGNNPLTTKNSIVRGLFSTRIGSSAAKAPQ